MQSWSYTVNELKFTLNEQPFIRQGYHYFNHIEWDLEELAGVMEVRDFGDQQMQTAIFKGSIKRVGNTINNAVTIPSIIVAFLGLGYVLLRETTHDRLPFINAILLTEIMFLVMMSTILPTAMNAPLLSRLMLILSVIVSIITLVQVGLVYIRLH